MLKSLKWVEIKREMSLKMAGNFHDVPRDHVAWTRMHFVENEALYSWPILKNARLQLKWNWLVTECKNTGSESLKELE